MCVFFFSFSFSCFFVLFYCVSDTLECVSINNQIDQHKEEKNERLPDENGEGEEEEEGGKNARVENLQVFSYCIPHISPCR